ncbi:MAG: transglycosylase SLT domain-containing protein [Myxococcota bacterium]
MIGWGMLAVALAADWRAAMGVGDCATVVRALEAPADDLERLALARCHVRMGEPGRALEVLGEPKGGLEPYAALVRARALLGRDRPEEAVAALQGVALPGHEDELVRGRALVEANRSLEARDGLRALLETSVGDEARWWLARGAEMRGDTEGALAAYRAIWTKTPTSPWSARAAERLGAMGAAVPDYGTADGRALAMERAKTLLKIKQAGEAVKLLDGVHAKAPFDSSSQQLYMAEALFDAKLYARAVEWYARCGADAVGAATAFSYALATARAGDYPAAAERYRALVTRWPDTSQADEAHWKQPYMDYDAGRLDDAVAGFGDYLAARPSGKFATDARWFRAWSRWRKGDVAGAVAGFDEVVAKHPQSELAVAARYWKARAKDDAVALREVMRAYPNSGYAWFAAQRLGVTFPVVADATPPELPAGFGGDRARLGVRLARAGMADWARPLLAEQVAAAKSAGKDAAIALAWALAAAEDYKGARALAAPYCGAGPVAAQVCTPRPHAAAVTAVAAEYGLNPLLPYAIMNAESGLDPSVTSPAGARGLMQLMPALASELAEGVVPGFTPDDLYLAGVNARLGTLELSLLHRRFVNGNVQPHLPLVIAGYNGGGDPVERWLAGYRTAPEADRFAEDISFTETRRYVRRVLGFLMEYRRVYGDR